MAQQFEVELDSCEEAIVLAISSDKSTSPLQLDSVAFPYITLSSPVKERDTRNLPKIL
jgi:hypothetical protein